MTRWFWPVLVLLLAGALAAQARQNIALWQMLGRADAAMSNLEGADAHLKRESAKLIEASRQLSAVDDQLRERCR